MYIYLSYLRAVCFFMLSYMHLLNKSIYKVRFLEIYITFTLQKASFNG